MQCFSPCTKAGSSLCQLPLKNTNKAKKNYRRQRPILLLLKTLAWTLRHYGFYQNCKAAALGNLWLLLSNRFFSTRW